MRIISGNRNIKFLLCHEKLYGRWQISTEGGTEPLRAPNGQELFCRSGDKLIAVAVETEPVFKVGNQKELFEAKGYVGWPLYTS